MKPAAFFRTSEVQALLERASRAAGTPLSVHYVERGEEGLRITGFGRCAACQHVTQLAGGIAKCRASRLEASVPALRRNKPMPYICHMGFACVSMPALPGSGLGFTLTFGPYCPAEAPQALENDALWGFAELGHNPEDGLPVTLADIHIAPADAVPAIAEWTSETLNALWTRQQAPDEPRGTDDGESADDTASNGRVGHRGRGHLPEGAPYDGAHIAAALAGGNGAQARKLVTAALAETESGSRTKVAVRRARTVAIVSASLEAAQRAGLNIAPCWDRLPAVLDELKGARTSEQMVGIAMNLLGIIRRRTQHPEADKDGLVTLSRLVMAHLTEGITLNDIAKELGQNPTAITHRLQRKFGLSFSQYLGQLRVNMAKDLLRCTRLSASEISRRVGIKDGSNLSKLFRKFEGMSPQDYRRRFGRKGG